MAAVTYKCPNCDGGLQFDPKSQKFKCEYCLAEFTKEELDRVEKETAREKTREEMTGEAVLPEGNVRESSGGGVAGAAASAGAGRNGGGAPAGLAPGAGGERTAAVIYTCPSCGAEIVTDETTAATFCYYCHNPVVLSGRLSGEYLPDYVLPFAVEKKKAKEIFLGWIGKKKFVPRSFFSEDQIEKFSGVYFPYLLYSCKVDGKIEAEAEKNRVWTAGNIRYTEHNRYQVEREGELDVKNVTRNALSKGNRELIENVLPFDMNQLLPFDMGYLSGFQAEKRDMDSDGYAPEVEKEVRDYAVQSLTGSVKDYSSVRVKNADARIRDPKWSYALLPLWVLTYNDKARGKIYYFAMNGQTGKVCGKLPVDKGKLAALFAGVFFPILIALLIGGWFL